jgi:hypothetical protein
MGSLSALLFLLDPAALSAVGPACSVRPAHPRLGPLDVFFNKPFILFLLLQVSNSNIFQTMNPN